MAVAEDDGIDADVQILPLRGQVMPAAQLLEAARTDCEFTALLAEVFGVAVQIPRFVDQQLRLGDTEDQPSRQPSANRCSARWTRNAAAIGTTRAFPGSHGGGP